MGKLPTRSVKRSYHQYNNSHSKLQLYDTYEGRQRFLWVVIGANTVVFGLWQYAKGSYDMNKFLHQHFTCSRFGVEMRHRYHTLLTSAFSHMDFGHYLINMIALYTFGSNTIHLLGLRPFVGMFFGGALVSSLFQLVWPDLIPKSWPARYSLNRNSAGLGASGAVNAIVACNILMFPKSMIYLYGIVPIPAALAGLAFLGLDAYQLYYGNSGVGNAAHISGAVVGVITYFATRGRLRRF
jgi:membrane associated rhomboid family serine protease